MVDHQSIEEKYERYHVDGEAYIKQAQTGPCFICQIAARNPDYPAYIVYEDDKAIAFLDKYPFLYGWTFDRSIEAVFKKGTLRIPEEDKESLATRLHDRIQQQHI